MSLWVTWNFEVTEIGTKWKMKCLVITFLKAMWKFYNSITLKRSKNDTQTSTRFLYLKMKQSGIWNKIYNFLYNALFSHLNHHQMAPSSLFKYKFNDLFNESTFLHALRYLRHKLVNLFTQNKVSRLLPRSR